MAKNYYGRGTSAESDQDYEDNSKVWGGVLAVVFLLIVLPSVLSGKPPVQEIRVSESVLRSGVRVERVMASGFTNRIEITGNSYFVGEPFEQGTSSAQIINATTGQPVGPRICARSGQLNCSSTANIKTP